MDGLPGALFTAGLALLAKIAFDGWTRVRERQAVASALAGEIAAYIQMMHPEKSAANFRIIKSLDPETRKLRLAAFPKPPTGHPVFDKVADKAGSLPPQEVSDISAFYNIVTGFRVHISNLSSPEFLAADVQFQSAAIDFLISVLDQAPSVYNLVRRLDWIASHGAWSMITTGTSVPSDLSNTLPRKHTFNLIPH